MTLHHDLSAVRTGRERGLTARRGENVLVLAVATVAYTVVGLWLVREMHVVDADTLERWSRALAIWHGDRPGLAAVGLDQPPLAVLVLAPFSVVPGLVTSQVVVAVVTAAGAGVTLVALNTMMRRSRLDLPVRLAVLVALGLNPLLVVEAATGGRDILWLALVVTALGALFAWYLTADIRFVMTAGLAFGGAALTGYDSLPLFVVAVAMVAAIVRRLGAGRTEIEGTTVGFASPTVYLLVLWVAVNLVVLGEPFHWLTTGRGASSSFLDAARGTGDLVLHGAPIALVVLPALVVVGLRRRNAFALWLGALLLVAIVQPGLTALVGATDRPMAMSGALPALLLSVVGAVWLARSAITGQRAVAGAVVAGLLLSVPWTFAAMGDRATSDVERSFHDAVRHGERA